MRLRASPDDGIRYKGDAYLSFEFATINDAVSPTIQAQIVADVLGEPIDVPLCEEGCRGAALLAAVAAGQMEIADAADLRSEVVRYEPNPANAEIYEGAYRRWLKLQRATDGATEAE